jgi:hypothetical protein
MMATRRLAAIFAADAIGYLRLMGDDERGTAGAVRKHREAAHRITLTPRPAIAIARVPSTHNGPDLPYSAHG